MLGEQGDRPRTSRPTVSHRPRRPWRARADRATPIRAGEAVHVAAIDGLLLEVEPLEGAAKFAGP